MAQLPALGTSNQFSGQFSGQFSFPPAASQVAAPQFSPATSQFAATSQFGATSQFAPATTSFAPAATSQFASSSASSTSVDAAFADLYDQTKFRSYNMVINPTNLALMNKDPKKELKVSCDVTTDYQGPQQQTYSSPNLACGYKGSVGALRVCFDVYGKFSPNDCRKASYKIDADYFNKNADDRIAGVRRIMFHGAPADWSMMAERLAYNLLAQWGIVAPAATHASLYLNGQFLGVFVFVSPIDTIFTQKHFGTDLNQGKGGLYKEAWFNPVHMRDLASTFYAGKNEDAFMNQIAAAVESTPLTKEAATQFFETYFDVNALVDVTAANTVLGNTDDWRQRHNLYWYIREDASGKKAVLIPWDYDRLNDEGADTRGALKGRPWWDPSTQQYCNSRLRTAAERGALKGKNDPMQVAYWTDVFEATPPDVEVPVSCDKIAQLMALALGTRIRQRTREFAASINRASLQANVQTWTNQIQSAISRDPDGPQLADMANEQRLLLDNLVRVSQKAVTDANNGDRGVSSAAPASSALTTSAGGTVFVPKAQANGGMTSSAGSTFVPKAQATGGQTFTGFVPKSTSTSVTGFVPKAATTTTSTTTTGAQAFSGSFVPKSTQTSFPAFSPQTTQSFQSSFSQPAFPSFASSSFPQQFSSFPATSTASSNAARFQPAPSAGFATSSSFASWGR